MNTKLKTLDPKAIRANVFKLIGDDWMLITAGTLRRWNTMTASWGGLGVLWNKLVVFAFVRPTRYTYSFMERSSRFRSLLRVTVRHCCSAVPIPAANTIRRRRPTCGRSHRLPAR